MDGAKGSAWSKDESVFAKNLCTFLRLHPTQVVAFQGIEQAHFLFISRLGRPYPHLCLRVII